MTKVLQERTLKDIDFIWDDKKQEIIHINHKDKCIQPGDYLTVAQIAAG